MIGTMISHYEVADKLGAGGMGEVYLAEDTKLERKVALKFLATNFTKDSEVNARFRREAKAAAALNHPNIVTVYEIGEHDGRAYIAMEYIDGQSLRDVMAASILSMNRIIEIVSQICAGLAKAHLADIVHRDLKPENIMLDKDGQVKILDFGLAKLKGKTKLTSEGSTLGTVYYMSPEQCHGEEVDHRTDIWAVGVMLYEMITGRLPFESEHEAAITYAILSEQPEPLVRYKSGITAAWQRIVDKALDKARETRYQHIDDLLTDLKREQKRVVTPIAMKKRKPKFALALTMVFAFVAIVAVVIAINAVRKQKPTPLAAKHRQVTFNGDVYLGPPSLSLDLAPVSPDGQFLAYVLPKDGTNSLMVRDISGGEPINIFSGFSVLTFLRWSPDGSELMFGASMPNDTRALGGHNYIIPRLGGKPQGFRRTAYACWSPDGSQYAGTNPNLQSVSLFNRATDDILKTIQLKGFKWFIDLDWSPAGDRLAFLTKAENINQWTIWTVKTDGTQQKKIIERDAELYSPRWSRDGRAIYYLRSKCQTTDLMRIAISSGDGTPKGKPKTLQTGLHAVGFTLSEDNLKLSYTKVMSHANLWLVTPQSEGKTEKMRTKKLTPGTSMFSWPELSPDGRDVAFVHQKEIFVMPSSGGDMQQLTFLNSMSYTPRWSPDGKELAFSSSGKIWRIPAAGGTPRQLDKTEASEQLTWSPGDDILYQRPGNQNFHFLNPTTEEETPLVADDSGGWILASCSSPDGNQIAIYWNTKTEGEGLWLISRKDTTQTRVQRGKLIPIQWSDDGAWVYTWNWIERPPKIRMIARNGSEAKVFATLPFENIPLGGITITPDGKRIVCSVQETISDVWLLENFDPEVKVGEE